MVISPDYVVTVEYVGGAAKLDKLPPMRVGQTVQYVGHDRWAFRVEFPPPAGSPYGNETSISDSNVRTLEKAGKFQCRCFITPPGGQEVGWSSWNPDAGGEHDVKP